MNLQERSVEKVFAGETPNIYMKLMTRIEHAMTRIGETIWVVDESARWRRRLCRIYYLSFFLV